jgi:5-methylcytosine-specific restriction endonuclease McrA
MLFNYKMVSSGEHLCSLLYEEAVNPEFWLRFQNKHLIATGRPLEFRLFFQKAIALNLTRRLILAGEEAKGQIEPSDPGFLQYLSPAIDRWGLHELNNRGRLARLIASSVIASNHNISNTLRDRFLRRARNGQQTCFMCGQFLNCDVDTNSFRHDDVTLDHLWPQAYGGDSIEDNILPACRGCNTGKKQDYPSWAGCNIHTLMIGTQPSGEALKSVGGHFKFALYNRAVLHFANQERITLKSAYLRIGPWTDTPWFIDEDELGDFFNLTNYNPERNNNANLFLQMS